MRTVLTQLEDGLATVTLNRPERLNALNEAMVAELNATLEQLMGSPEVGAIILTGAGERAFCAGEDLVDTLDLPEAEARRAVEGLQQVTRRILFGDKIVVAAVNGWAIGGGFELVLNCDLSIWASTAGGFLPELRWGLGVSGASTWLLPHLVGWQHASRIFLLGERQSAEALHEAGLVYAVAPPDRLAAETRALALRLAALPAAAVAGFKRARIAAHRAAIEQALKAEADNLVGRLLDPDTHERMRAFRADAR